MSDVLTVNGGSHSLHLIAVADDETDGARLDRSDPPGSDEAAFTGEIGWDQPEVRRDICAGLGLLGVPLPVTGKLDHDGPVSPPDATVPVLVVEPHEELQIARDTRAAL
jgi:acetate kinase